MAKKVVLWRNLDRGVGRGMKGMEKRFDLALTGEREREKRCATGLLLQFIPPPRLLHFNKTNSQVAAASFRRFDGHLHIPAAALSVTLLPSDRQFGQRR